MIVTTFHNECERDFYESDHIGEFWAAASDLVVLAIGFKALVDLHRTTKPTTTTRWLPASMILVMPIASDTEATVHGAAQKG